MTPEVYYLELHLAQVANEMALINKKVESGLYSNKKLKEYISTLNQITTEILKEDLSTKTDNDKCQIRDILLFISRCVQYIKAATTKDMNTAVYVCLRAALEDWVKNDSKNYVVSTYKADVGTHHYTNATVDCQVIKEILDNYNISLPSKLVALGYPSYLEKDFLSNVSLYHELGHFIDIHEWSISAILTKHICQNKCLPLHDDYFVNIDIPYLYDDTKPEWNDMWVKLFCMLSEYFADIFAVQYIGRHKIHLSNYMAGDNGFSDDHPSTEARIKAINNFLEPDAIHDDFIKMLKWATKSITGRDLKLRNADLDGTSLLSYQPCSITQKEQLHTVLHKAWEIWEFNQGGFKDNLNTVDAYCKLNDLLELSIMNFENSR